MLSCLYFSIILRKTNSYRALPYLKTSKSTLILFINATLFSLPRLSFIDPLPSIYLYHFYVFSNFLFLFLYYLALPPLFLATVSLFVKTSYHFCHQVQSFRVNFPSRDSCFFVLLLFSAFVYNTFLLCIVFCPKTTEMLLFSMLSIVSLNGACWACCPMFSFKPKAVSKYYKYYRNCTNTFISIATTNTTITTT